MSSDDKLSLKALADFRRKLLLNEPDLATLLKAFSSSATVSLPLLTFSLMPDHRLASDPVLCLSSTI
jgi:hypothetical protein